MQLHPADTEKQYFSFDNYEEITIQGAKDATTESVYELFVVYNKNVKQVNIKLQFNDKDKTQILDYEKIVVSIVYPNGRTEITSWNEEEKMYIAHLPFDKVEELKYQIKVILI